ncbi:MAG: AMIN domain-containing protein [Tissierellia bacterium]|nr:AMIN domain-containing protein [Tissierellia bacterium]
MRKWKVVLSLVLIFIFISSMGLAAGANKSINISMDGKKYTVKEVPVVMDGQAVYSDIPTFIHPIKDYTLVPIRFIAESYGAEVTWDQKTKTATVLLKDKEIKVTINSKYIYINGEKKLIEGEAVPKLVTFSNNDSRTMVPLRVISEALGFEVGWDSKNRVPFINTKNSSDDKASKGQITSVQVEKGSGDKPKLVIKGTDKLNYSTLSLKNPDRLIIDIENVRLNIKDKISFEGGVGQIQVNEKPINRISVSQFSTNPDVVRVVIHLAEEVDFDIVTGGDGKSLTLSFVNRVRGIEKEIVDGKEALVIYNTEKVKTNIIHLSNPRRVVVDLLDSVLERGSYFKYDYDIGFIKGVRTSQFEPDKLYKPNDRIVRVVLDIKDGIEDPQVKINAYHDKIVIIPETGIGEVIHYSIKGDNRVVSVSTLEETDYTVEYTRETNTMVISLPWDKLDIKEGSMTIQDGLINDIKVTSSGGTSKIILTFRRGIEYSLLSHDTTDKIAISIKRDENEKPSDKLIVIDPGHGGHDPGAVQNGTLEKDVNLAVSLKLNERLKSLGYNTIMTRDTDVYIELKERAAIANRNMADLFISIHANSNSDSSVSGIQVLYHAYDKATVKKDVNLQLAKIMMEEITKGTGAQDRGLITRERTVVIRDTEMPSVLIEIGFLTNKEEVQLLQDDAYQNKIVESIVKGIEKFFDMY